MRCMCYLALVAALLVGGFGAVADEVTAPDAVQVLVRGKRDLGEALAVAAQPAWAEEEARPVLLIVDVTPNTRRAREDLATALSQLDLKAAAVPSWSIARLDDRPSRSVPRAAELVDALDEVFESDSEVVSTLTALAASLRPWREKHGVVVYLADWHFEDDVDLEKFLRDLERKGRTLSVVGTEAAYGRGWNDGLRSGTDRLWGGPRGIELSNYWEGVGRDPFRGRDKRAPWHGGDTAYPHVPYRWDFTLWKTAFSAWDWELADLEDEGDGADAGTAPSGTLLRLAELFGEIAALEEELAGAADAERADLEARLAALRTELAALQEELGLGEPTDGAAKPDALDEEIAMLEDELRRLDDQLALAEDEVERRALAARRDDVARELADLREQQEEAEPPEPPLPSPPEVGPPETPDEPAVPEDLRDRLPGGAPDPAERPDVLSDEDRSREYPLPSAFGPYALMRVAGVTGGRYVLWSWNPSGRKTVLYEYSRCNLFPPDLRARDEILADLRENPYAGAMQRAWNVIVDTDTGVIDHTPPVDRRLRTPQSVDRVPPSSFYTSSIFDDPGERKQFYRGVERAVEGLEEALAILDESLDGTDEPHEPTLRRCHAEALLLRHIVRLARFQLRESAQAAAEIPRSAWRVHGESPGVSDRSWVEQGRNPSRIEPSAVYAPYDFAEAQRLLDERKMLLERFRGTPIAELVALNTIDTARPSTWHDAAEIPETGRSPSESMDTPTPTPRTPGGGSGGAGPATGGR